MCQCGPRGFHTTAQELRTCTFQGCGASNTTKIPREHSQRRRKREFWAHLRGHPSGPHLFWVWAPFGAHTFGEPFDSTPNFTKPKLPSWDHPPKGKKRNKKKRTLVQNLRCPNQIGPKSWPKLAEPKSVFQDRAQVGQGQSWYLRPGLSRPGPDSVAPVWSRTDTLATSICCVPKKKSND